MLSNLRHPATIIATLALLVALGAPAWAASFINGSRLAPGTVTGRQLRNGSVTGVDLAAGAVAGRQLKNGSVAGVDLATGIRARLLGTDVVTSAHVRDGAISETDLDAAVQAKLVPELTALEPLRAVGTAGEPPFLNGWDNIGTNGGPVQFRKDRDGIVHIYGTATKGANSAVESFMFTLPVGYRPSTAQSFPVASHDPTFTTWQPGMVTILTTGNVDVMPSVDDRSMYFGSISYPTA